MKLIQGAYLSDLEPQDASGHILLFRCEKVLVNKIHIPQRDTKSEKHQVTQDDKYEYEMM